MIETYLKKQLITMHIFYRVVTIYKTWKKMCFCFRYLLIFEHTLKVNIRSKHSNTIVNLANIKNIFKLIISNC